MGEDSVTAFDPRARRMEIIMKDSSAMVNSVTNCSALLPSPLLVGPGEVGILNLSCEGLNFKKKEKMAATFHELTSKEFASLGFWAIPMFSILFSAFLPVWVVGLTTLRNLKTQVLFLKYKKVQCKLLLLFIHRWIYVKLLFL